MLEVLALIPRCGILLLVVFAPCAMGSIPGWAEALLIGGCWGVAALHIPDFATRRAWEGLPRLPLLLLALVLVEGWAMALHARFVYADVAGRLVPLPAALDGWPGTYDREASIQVMTRLTAFAAVFVVMLDLSRDPAWRRRVLMAIGLTGIGLTAFGLTETGTGWVGLWPQYGHNVWPFATYFYHGNAGAFINLAFPLIVAFTVRAFFFATDPWWRGLWILGLAVAIAGAFVNASKAAQAVFLGLALLSLVLWARLLRKRIFTRKMMLRALIVLPAFILAVAGVLYFGDLGQALARWTQAIHQAMLVSGGRLSVAQVCLRLIPQGGFFGYGPGSFTNLFPYATFPEGRTLWGFWRYAHEDYLQTALEWGWLGAALWGALFLGGIVSAFRIMARPRKTLRLRSRVLLWGTGCALLGCAFHAAVDFPLQIPSIEFYVFLLLAVAWGAWNWPREGKAHR